MNKEEIKTELLEYLTDEPRCFEEICEYLQDANCRLNAIYTALEELEDEKKIVGRVCNFQFYPYFSIHYWGFPESEENE